MLPVSAIALLRLTIFIFPFLAKLDSDLSLPVISFNARAGARCRDALHALAAGSHSSSSGRWSAPFGSV